MNIILPKHDTHLQLTEIPFFYLIGPVLGGGDWQYEMCLDLMRQVGECTIAVPNQWTETHPLKKYFAGTRGSYTHQLDWKQVYIKTAYTRPNSCLVCWLSRESPTNPRQDGNPYGRDTYGDLGYFRGLYEQRLKSRKAKFPIVIGGDYDFPGLDVISRNWNYSSRSLFPIHQTIRQTAYAAATIVSLTES